MPELPEVEIITKQLQKILTGRKITRITDSDQKMVDTKIAALTNLTIKNVFRRGKSIIFDLIGESKLSYYLLIHLRMTGHFHHITDLNNKAHRKYFVVKFHLDDGSFLTHNSIRRFGSIRLLSLPELQDVLSKLGPEPLEISSKEFLARIRRSSQANIKNKLMEQHFLAGIGNIYAQEALYHAGINPRKKIGETTGRKLERLHQELKRILRLAIKEKGSTVSNYSHLSGEGNFQNLLAVYGRKECPKSHPLRRIKIGGRETSYCPQCQK